MRCYIIKTFPYSFDGITELTAVPDTHAEIPDAFVPGLIREGFVADPDESKSLGASPENKMLNPVEGTKVFEVRAKLEIEGVAALDSDELRLLCVYAYGVEIGEEISDDCMRANITAALADPSLNLPFDDTLGGDPAVTPDPDPAPARKLTEKEQLIVDYEAATGEKVDPSWTIADLKTKLIEA